jgi:thymidylate synthase
MQLPIEYATSNVWRKLLADIIYTGSYAAPRELQTREILGCQTRVPMSYPVMGVQERKLGYKFMAAEAAWIMSGDNRVATISPYSKQISRFSDDGTFFFGAYGPKIRDQLPYVISKLKVDIKTRHALINIWREQPRATKDVPCTVSLQWVIRNNKLHCIDTMRSSDVWLGWPYDVFNMSMISLYLLVELRTQAYDQFKHIELGDLILTAASQHLYEPQFIAADEISKLELQNIVASRHFAPDMYGTGEQLIDTLWAIARADPPIVKDFLLEAA